MKPAINCFFVILVILILSQSSQALIVWDGKIVDAWPQEVHQVVLGKRAVLDLNYLTAQSQVI